MQTLTYGRKKPEDRDPGSEFWDALADNVTLDDSHDHDGVDSPRVLSNNLTRGSVAVTGAGWTVQADGTYRKSVTMPAGWTYENSVIAVYYDGGDNDDKLMIATTVPINSTSFYLYSFSGTQAFTVRCT